MITSTVSILIVVYIIIVIVEKHLVSGAVFKSNTSRWMSANIRHGASNPGPGTYNPSLIDKRSYLYNVQGKWI